MIGIYVLRNKINDKKYVGQSIDLEKRTNEHMRPTKAVMCIETETIYGSIGEATRETDINYGSLWATVNGKRKTAGGFRWRFI